MEIARFRLTIDKINNHYINIVKYNTSERIIINPTTQKIEKGLINMENEDNECFRWSHIRHLNPQEKDPQRIKKSDKAFINKLDYLNIEFPVNVTDVKQYNKVEKQNNININVFGYELEIEQPYSIYVFKEKFDDQMNLLLITEG